jgi:hypothetical protein
MAKPEVVEPFAKVHGAGYDPANHLRIENQKLMQQLAQQQMIIQQRAMHAVGQFAEGLAFLIAHARAGDPNARQSLTMLRDGFDEMRLIGLIKVPGEDNGKS